MISLTMAFWASSYSSLLLVYSSFRELSLLQANIHRRESSDGKKKTPQKNEQRFVMLTLEAR